MSMILSIDISLSRRMKGFYQHLCPVSGFDSLGLRIVWLLRGTISAPAESPDRMKRGSLVSLIRYAVCLLTLVSVLPCPAQSLKSISGADDRFKADILVVVAHPD